LAKKGKLYSALKNVIFPYLFNNQYYEYLESSFNNDDNEKYLLRLGFEPTIQRDKLKLHRKNVVNVKIKPIVNTPSLVCSGQVKLATVLYSNQYCCSARLGGNPSLC